MLMTTVQVNHNLANELFVPLRFTPKSKFFNIYNPCDLLNLFKVAHVDRLITTFHGPNMIIAKMMEIQKNLQP